MLLLAVKVPESVGIQKKLTSIHIDQWLHQSLFHPRWWIMIGLGIAFIIIWILLLKKENLRQVILYTAIAFILTLGLVEYGDELVLWKFPVDTIPIFTALSSLNLVSLPLVYSIIFQNFKSMRSFLAATLIATAIICFIFEPLLSWAGFYQLLHWEYYYSFPIYIGLAVVSRLIVGKILKINQKANTLYWTETECKQ